MGVDGYFFDVVSRECIYYDRELNLYDKLETDGGWDIFRRLRGEVEDYSTDPDNWACVGAAEAHLFLDELLAEYAKDPEDRHVWAAQVVKAFVQARPEGRFFIRNDHQEPPSWVLLKGSTYTTRPSTEPVWKGGYQEVK